MSKVVRSVKNVTKGYSTVQVKVRNGRSSIMLRHGRLAADNLDQQLATTPGVRQVRI